VTKAQREKVPPQIPPHQGEHFGQRSPDFDQTLNDVRCTLSKQEATSVGAQRDCTRFASPKSLIADQTCRTDQMDRNNNRRVVPKPGPCPMWPSRLGNPLPPVVKIQLPRGRANSLTESLWNFCS
jgi:hypothetical protein